MTMTVAISTVAAHAAFLFVLIVFFFSYTDRRSTKIPAATATAFIVVLCLSCHVDFLLFSVLLLC